MYPITRQWERGAISGFWDCDGGGGVRPFKYITKKMPQSNLHKNSLTKLFNKIFKNCLINSLLKTCIIVYYVGYILYMNSLISRPKLNIFYPEFFNFKELKG